MPEKIDNVDSNWFRAKIDKKDLNSKYDNEIDLIKKLIK